MPALEVGVFRPRRTESLLRCPGAARGAKARSRGEPKPEVGGENLEKLVRRFDDSLFGNRPFPDDELAVEQCAALALAAGTRDDQVLHEARRRMRRGEPIGDLVVDRMLFFER